MRVVAEISHPSSRISIFYMNQKYMIKIEQGNYEQTYKVSELDYIITGLDDIKKIVNEAFIQKCLKTFEVMRENIAEELKDF